MAVDHPLSPDEELTCGRLLSQVWDQALDPAPAEDPHTMTCPFCHEAIASLAAVKAATRALRGQAPTYLRSLADGVMNIVRSEARLGRLLPLADPVRDLRIAENAAAKVLRQAADNVPGVRAAACRLAPAGSSDADNGVAVALTLAVSLDRPFSDRTDEVRRAVIHAAERTIGLHVTAVDITVIDTLDPSAPARRRQPGDP